VLLDVFLAVFAGIAKGVFVALAAEVIHRVATDHPAVVAGNVLDEDVVLNMGPVAKKPIFLADRNGL
jgi:hypothetical protein